MDKPTKTIKADNIASSISFKSIDETNNSNISRDIIDSTKTALINSVINSNLALMPKLLINDYSKGSKVLSEIISELNSCSEFMFSVAFITNSGITPLLETLKILKEKNIKGRIITTDYLNFSEPKALKKLLEFDNINLKMYTKDSFHTKGYIFKKSDHYKIIVGSSNLTQTALTKNKEWNIKISSLEEGSLTGGVLDEFELMWNQADFLSIEWIETYEKIYKKQREALKNSTVPRISQYTLHPNKMQIAAISSLDNLRRNGIKKAILISATGTGKTYLSAFDVRNFNPHRALFIVHREKIAKQALESFKNVFEDTLSMGLLSGNYKNTDSNFLFSTNIMLAKDEILFSFKRDAFDYIIIDEVHKAGGNTYQKIIDYFHPKFLLGMTATPERSDDFDIFKMFDHNIAYEIRLQQALEEDLLCPFHYFGITDVSIDGNFLDEASQFHNLVSNERVTHIIDKINFYGFSGDKVRGLVFCRNIKEAKELSNSFNNRGLKTLYLDGSSSNSLRDEAIERLELAGNNKNYLDYIFTVDIFNEGVDIPSVNQIIMLRPTKSAIVFVQQLGRGLRKSDNKEFVVVIDFVGNYKNNFLIPIALSGDNTYNKDTIRKYVMEGSRIIPGCSTVNFDEISKKRIFESIDNTNFNAINFIKESYNTLKQKMGKIPSLMDFDTYNSIDPIRIFENNSLGSYHVFLKKYDKDYKINFSKIQSLFIEFISKKLASGKRIHELEMLKLAILYKHDLMSKLRETLKLNYNIMFKPSTEISVFNVLTNNFATGTGKTTYSNCIFLKKTSHDYDISEVFEDNLKDEKFKQNVLDLLEFGIYRFKKNFSDNYLNTNFKLYQKYTYEDVCRILEWDKNVVATNIGGYAYNKTTNTFPVFINYNKSEDISDSIRYKDRFISPSTIIGLSKHPRNLSSSDIMHIKNSKETGLEISLFVRKNKDDKISKEFYFLGKVTPTGNFTAINMDITNDPAVEIEYSLHTPVRDDIYDYIIS
ncbi:PLD-like domain-containing protein [Clostridium acidisoli DSM 12555]|uniref:PLD-like domain-containing protein n=1 Tax=Clostridium acidisoli DSM 12555 TaxID=1121291 RepID=A0A1W1WYG2_9CLOT|nr:DEAD/DEAH box helicase [Clostridium acidisoli]SMC16468.1 PLD-like domain-containing protein [Clostridium acidisoli DSM 12555]